MARVSNVATLTARVLTEPMTEEPFRFCPWAARPGDLVVVDTSPLGYLKDVGKVYQQIAIDTATRCVMIHIVPRPVTGEHTRRLLDLMWRRDPSTPGRDLRP